MERMGSMGSCAAALCTSFALLALAGAAEAGGKNSTTRCDVAKTRFVTEIVECMQKAQVREILTGESNAFCGIDNIERLGERWRAIERRAGGACSQVSSPDDPFPFPSDFFEIAFNAQQFRDSADLLIRPPTKIILFDGGAFPNGGFRFRGPNTPPGESLSCNSAAAQAGLECTAVNPLLWVSDVPLWSVLRSQRPQGLPIVSQSGVTIADNADDFLDGSWDACLQDSAGPDCTVAAGVLPDDTRWWHGSNSEGQPEEGNCADWTFAHPIAGTTAIGRSDADGQKGHLSQWTEPDPEYRAECDGSNLPAPTHVVCACASR